MQWRVYWHIASHLGCTREEQKALLWHKNGTKYHWCTVTISWGHLFVHVSEQNFLKSHSPCTLPLRSPPFVWEIYFRTTRLKNSFFARAVQLLNTPWRVLGFLIYINLSEFLYLVLSFLLLFVNVWDTTTFRCFAHQYNGNKVNTLLNITKLPFALCIKWWHNSHVMCYNHCL